jgi:CHASE1-domain containing sensor protein
MVKGAIIAEENRIQAEFDEIAVNTHRKIVQKFSYYAEISTLAGNLLTEENSFSEAYFNRLTSNIRHLYKHFDAIGWIEKVTAAQRNVFEQAHKSPITVFKQTADGLEKVTAPEHHVYYPVLYINSRNPNKPLQNFDVSRVEKAQFFINKAAQENKTQMIELKLDSLYKNADTMTITPVYHFGKPASAENLKGIVSLAFAPIEIISDAIAETIDEDQQAKFAYSIIKGDKVIYDSTTSDLKPNRKPIQEFSLSKAIIQLDADISVKYRSNALFLSQYNAFRIWVLVVMGAAFSFFISTILFIVSGQVIYRDKEVKKRTSQLQTELSKRRENEIEQQYKNRALQSIATSEDLKDTFIALERIIHLKHPKPITSAILLDQKDNNLVTHYSEGQSDEFNNLVDKLRVKAETETYCKED